MSAVAYARRALARLFSMGNPETPATKECPPCERRVEGCLRGTLVLTVLSDQPCPPCACTCPEPDCQLDKSHEGLCRAETLQPDWNIAVVEWCKDCGAVGGGGSTEVDDYDKRGEAITREVRCRRCNEPDDDVYVDVDADEDRVFDWNED